MSQNLTDRPEFFQLQNGEKANLLFSDIEYENRLAKLRQLMADNSVDAMLLTSMHNIAYYSGFLYCSFGRPYACVVTSDRCVTISANIDGGQPWRRCYGDNIIYTDWKRNNYWRAIKLVIGNTKHVGIEGDHMTLASRQTMTDLLGDVQPTDLNQPIMGLRMIKSAEEIALIKGGARTADIGGEAVRDAIKVGTREIDVAMAGRDAMEIEISRAYPDSELRDSWVWFQAGLNTDGAHNPVTTAKLVEGDILSLNTFPMISGYYTALERTLFIGEPDAASLKIWEANVGAHELGISLIKQGATCAGICEEINRYFADLDLYCNIDPLVTVIHLACYPHYYGREAGPRIT